MDTGSTEPSMDDILASIQRIITDDPSGLNAARKPRPSETAPPAAAQADEDVLELTSPVAPKAPDPMDWPLEAAAVPPPPPAAAAPAPTPQAPPPAPAPEIKPAVATTAPTKPDSSAKPDTLVSDKAARASRDALNSLSSLLVTPAAGSGDGTLEGLVREMLRPMLKEWLDDRLPAMVEEMVAKEIARISGREG